MVKSIDERNEQGVFDKHHAREVSSLTSKIEEVMDREWYSSCAGVHVPISYPPHEVVMRELQRLYGEKGFSLTIQSEKKEGWSQRDNATCVDTSYYIFVEEA